MSNESYVQMDKMDCRCPFHIITDRNEVLAKEMFLHVSVILLTGGEYLTRHPPGPGRYTPPRPGRYTPLWQVHPPAGTPPGRYTPQTGTPPSGRYTPQAGTPPGQVHHPPGRYTPPPWQVHPPGRYPPLAGTPPQAGTPLGRYTTPPGRYTPPWQVHPPAGTPPPEQQTPEYGQRSAGTHPTGMHSCFLLSFVEQLIIAT